MVTASPHLISIDTSSFLDQQNISYSPNPRREGNSTSSNSLIEKLQKLRDTDLLYQDNIHRMEADKRYNS